MDKPAPADHPIHHLIAARWSPVGFSSKPVAEQALATCFEAARWSASCFNAQPWAFVVATAAEPDRLAAFRECLVPGNQEWANRAPVLFFAVAKTRFEMNGKPNRWAPYDLGQAMTSFSLQATALGLVVHQMGGFDAAAAARVCGLPEDTEVMAAVALGHPGDVDGLSEKLQGRQAGPRVRKPQGELVFRGRWG